MTALLTIVFLLSGAAGLMYESVWSRYLGLFVGHSAYAQVIVIVIYLGGMAVGAAIVARKSERIRDPLTWYGAIEVIVGTAGVFFHPIFELVTGFAYDSLFPALGGGVGVVMAKWTLASVLILPQSILLGATFPLMAAAVMRISARGGAGDGSGRVVGQLYFANSMGAAVGVLIAGFALVSAVGLPGTMITAGMVNCMVGLVAIGAARYVQTESAFETADRRPDSGLKSEPTAADSSPLTRETGDQTPVSGLGPRLSTTLLIVAAGTAITSFMYEIAWVRMLSLVLGSATHSFELMLSAFILGLALGALWVRNRADRFADPVHALAVAQWAMGALAIATLAAYLTSFRWMAFLVQGLDQNAQGYTLFTVAKYAIALVVMLPATFCAGITLPLITRILMSSGSGERAIGTVYAVNTLGSIIGAGVSALVLMPLIGLRALLVAGGVLDMALGTWLFFISAREQGARRRLVILAVTATLGVGLLGGISRFDRDLLVSGVYRYGMTPGRADPSALQFYRDGRTATVSVRHGTDGSRSIATNGKPDASLSGTWYDTSTNSGTSRLGGDESTQLFLALTTLAHVPDARRAAVIGHGSGMSSHFLLGSPVIEELVTIDIEPNMVAGSREFLPANRRAFEDPRSRFVYDDAKSYFASRQGRFDLILSEPSNPWVSGVSGLFTDEFYSRVRGYLTPGGVFGQWLHLYEIDDEMVLSVVKAVHRNFASYEIFLAASSDLLIVASGAEQLPAPAWRIYRLPSVVKDLEKFYDLTPEALEATRLVSREALAPMLGDGAGANSDYYPVLDLAAEGARYEKRYATGFAGLAEDRFDVGAMLTERRVGPGTEMLAPLEIARIRSRANSAALRSGQGGRAVAGLDRPMLIGAEGRRQALNDRMAARHPQADWMAFMSLVRAVDSDIHQGTMGWADESFYGPVLQYLVAQRAPSDMIATLRFVRAVSGYHWAEAAREVDAVVSAAERGDRWLPLDDLREAATITLLRAHQAPRARAVFDMLARHSERRPGDLRTRLVADATARAMTSAGPSPRP